MRGVFCLRPKGCLYNPIEVSNSHGRSVTRSIDGLPDKFGTQVNILADDELRLYNQAFL